MTVIADTSPLQYAVEIEVAPSIFMLYGRIVIPEAVSSEMRHPSAPLLLRRWVEDHQDKIQVRFVQGPDDPRLAFLDLGEREAIVLAERTPGSLLIIDDGDGREEARRRGLRITGLLGVIRDAALRGFLDFDEAIQKLRSTAFVYRQRLRLWRAGSIASRHAEPVRSRSRAVESTGGANMKVPYKDFMLCGRSSARRVE